MDGSKEGVESTGGNSVVGQASYNNSEYIQSNYTQNPNTTQTAFTTGTGYPAYYGYGTYTAYNYGDTSISGVAAAHTIGDSSVTPMLATSVPTMGPISQSIGTQPHLLSQNIALSTEKQLESVQRCHMHKKPDLNCKFCRKYKSAVHELSRLTSQINNQEPVEKPDQLPMTNSSTYNLNTVLLTNILNSDYYKSLSTMTSHLDVISELAQYADHAEPYCSTATRAPSTLFCCLHKLFTLRLTEKQMEDLVDCTKSPYPRCCGFLYLRFVLPSDQLWVWFEPYLMDDESFVVSVNPTRKTTIGEFCERLLVADKYFNTVLPRLPVRFKNRYGPHLCSMSEHRRRRVRNLENIDDFVPDKTAYAFIHGEWVEGKIESVAMDYPTVTLIMSDGEKESVDIGYVSLTKIGQSDSKRHRESDFRGSSRSKASESPKEFKNSKDALLREFKRRESERALAVGKDYAKRPTSFKTSLSSKMDNKHGRLTSCSNTPRCQGGYPLRIEVALGEDTSKVEQQELNPEFIRKMLQRMDYGVLVEAARSVGLELPDSYSDADLESDTFISQVHRCILEFHVVKGTLTCPKCDRVYDIDNGIPNMLHTDAKE
ncbi:Pre-mRNA-splicing factor 38B [Babesia sp. Xinjiang]|uniref:Pre-mRNA-splicing factor 38B n=1 Tax=Babesia sp. Xinjiang TaxID=462227 RepID=UPI000A236110|nr:Pre-mRNA-splicing factor 38B [Babesia sp. Xinjiang]ORM39992.1 Pre-mRNA-splicing factor 38B [Babesia sp. Xinjiang]